MIARELRSHWEAEAATPDRDSYQGKRVLSVTSLETYAGVEKAGQRRFVALRLDGAQRRAAADRYPRSSRGIVVESVETGAGKVAIFLREQAGVPASVFPAVMSDVLEAAELAPSGAGLRRALERFSSWQFALKRQDGAQSAQVVRGIFGEMIAFRDLVSRSLGPARALQTWRAPEDDDVHDFVGKGWELEVKTKLAPGNHVHVNADGQLEPREGNTMILAAVTLEPAPDGISLRGLESDLLASVAAIPDVAEGLRDAFVKRGAKQPDLEPEAARPYRVQGVELFTVSAGFPLIPGRSLPVGVEGVRYEINLSTCSRFIAAANVLLNTERSGE